MISTIDHACTYVLVTNRGRVSTEVGPTLLHPVAEDVQYPGMVERDRRKMEREKIVKGGSEGVGQKEGREGVREGGRDD